jgi:hypothetical protein
MAVGYDRIKKLNTTKTTAALKPTEIAFAANPVAKM